MNEELRKPAASWKAKMRFFAAILILLGLVFVFVGAIEGNETVGLGSGGCFFWPFPIVFACGFGSSSLEAFVPLFLAAMAGLIVLQMFLVGWQGRRNTKAD